MVMYVILGAALVGMFLDFILNKTNLFDAPDRRENEEPDTENPDDSDKDV